MTAKRKAARDPLARQKGETHLEWVMRKARTKATSRNREDPIVPPEALQHGQYEQDFVTNVDDGTKAYTVINRGGTPICRWIARKRLSESQLGAIWYVTRLWALSGLRTALTANYGERLPGSGPGGSFGSATDGERRALSEIEARRELTRIQGYIPKGYWDVFENVVRHGIAAGVAGAALGHASRDAKHTAYLTVCFVADTIAMKERL